MNLLRFNKPVYGYNGFDSVINELFNELGSDEKHHGACFSPAVNIRENEKMYVLEFSVPGYRKEQFSISKENKLLSVKAEVEKTEVESVFKHKEFGARSFERSFGLPEGVDEENINAKYADGILEVTVPKKEVLVKNIEVEVPIK